jgi:hypothetical protein
MKTTHYYTLIFSIGIVTGAGIAIFISTVFA